MVATLKTLRDAPLVDEDYRRPGALFARYAAGDVFIGMVGENVLGNRPKPGDSARTTGDFAASYKSRVLPAFISVVDDPTMKLFGGKSLIGSYNLDDDGVAAALQHSWCRTNATSSITCWDASPFGSFHRIPTDTRSRRTRTIGLPNIGNLDQCKSKEPLSPEDLKKKLLISAARRHKPFGYYVDDAFGSPTSAALYRVYVADGHEELVRGAEFDELDTRTLRNDLIALGNDALVSNREGAIPTTVVSPSMLIDELEVKRNNQSVQCGKRPGATTLPPTSRPPGHFKKIMSCWKS